MKIAVIDGQGGGIGRLIVEKLRQELGPSCQIIGLGTNAIATSMMLKAGANEGATGENAIIYNVARAGVIVGSVAIIVANAYSGELTSRMAEAIATSEAVKVLMPINPCGLQISGVADEPLPVQVDHLVNKVKEFFEKDIS
ncbi:MAG: DUF3842 family protein [Syntrophomonadaceae bacterium]